MAAVPDRPLDQAAVADCHAALSKMLERYAWAVVRDWSLAADVVQTSFVALSRFGGDVALEARKSWLFRVVHREAMRVREQQKPYNQTTLESTEAVFEAQASYEISPLSKMAKPLLKRYVSSIPCNLSSLALDRNPSVVWLIPPFIPIAGGNRF